ncbi:MAG TPA: hypothetical protein VK112_03055, partial [Fodinibius sp.]|nr:hypothetical protein [Fodinibius sp.]
EKGSGKTTFLELAADELSGDKPLYRLSVEQTIRTEEDLLNLLCKDLDLPQAESTESMIKALKKEEDRRIVFLESIQNCFVRNINGYEAIQKLCYLISETRQHVFWIVSCSRYGWHFLDEVLSVNEYFSHMIRTDTLDPAKIEKLIMSRHEASGYLLRFEKKPDVRNKQTSEKLSQQEQQEKLRADYFQQLAKIADGNASIAILFWIRSIQSFDDSCFTIKPLETTSIEMVEELNPEVLFALAAVVIHDVITDEDLSMILNVSREESRLMLNRLSSRGLLLRNGEQHKLNHKVYRQIIRVLRERNIIHLV